MTTTVVNRKKEQEDIYIGRGSIWGNPFRISTSNTRGEVIEMYREYLSKQPDLLAQVHTLKDKRLGCYCKPAACHGDVLAELADAFEPLTPTEADKQYLQMMDEHRRRIAGGQ